MSKILIWNQKLGKPECPYMRRWVFNFGLFSIRIHNWYSGDDPRNMHDHPWNFLIYVIKGSYTDISERNEEIVRESMTAGTIKYRPALFRHTVETKGCWTLLLTGPVVRDWGFYIKNKIGGIKFLKSSRYFRKFGHHPCN